MFTPRWRRSSYSSGNGTCVEVAYLAAEWRGTLAVGVRDSKDRSGPVLLLPSSAFTDLLHTTTR